jgi:rhodanese-related sulfurtransferase
MPLNEVIPRSAELPDGPLWVHCGTGFRASIAASILHNAGHHVILVDDPFASAVAADLPLVSAGSGT